MLGVHCGHEEPSYVIIILVVNGTLVSDLLSFQRHNEKTPSFKAVCRDGTEPCAFKRLPVATMEGCAQGGDARAAPSGTPS
jgi:hypothetical protein